MKHNTCITATNKTKPKVNHKKTNKMTIEAKNLNEPQIDEDVEFETTNVLLTGEFADRHSVGVFWAKNLGYFYDEQVVTLRSSYCHITSINNIKSKP